MTTALITDPLRVDDTPIVHSETLGPFDVSAVDPAALQLPSRHHLGKWLHTQHVRMWIPTGARIFQEGPDGGAPDAIHVTYSGARFVLGIYGAAKGQSYWADVQCHRDAMYLTDNGCTPKIVDGPFGREVVANTVDRSVGGPDGHTVVRIVGVDGPRWMVRLVCYAPATATNTMVDTSNLMLSDMVVFRGGQPVLAGYPLEMPITRPADLTDLWPINGQRNV